MCVSSSSCYHLFRRLNPPVITGHESRDIQFHAKANIATPTHLLLSNALASGLRVSRHPRRKTETETRKTFCLNTTLAPCQDAEVSTGQKCLSKLRPEEVPAHPPHLTSTPHKRVVPCPIPLPLPLSTRKPKHSPPLGCFHAHQTAICVLHARRLVGAFAQTLQVNMTTVGGEMGGGRGPTA